MSGFLDSLMSFVESGGPLGNMYYLIAIVAVVVLLLVLLIVLGRRGRGKARSAGASTRSRRVDKPTVAPGAPQPYPVPLPDRSPSSEALADRGPTPTGLGQPAGYAPPTSQASQPSAGHAEDLAAAAAAAETGPDASQARRTDVRPTGSTGGISVSLASPMVGVLTELVSGEGDLGTDELRRLQLFRPEKILEAADKVELPKGGRAASSALTRLEQIREFALSQTDDDVPDLSQAEREWTLGDAPAAASVPSAAGAIGAASALGAALTAGVVSAADAASNPATSVVEDAPESTVSVTAGERKDLLSEIPTTPAVSEEAHEHVASVPPDADMPPWLEPWRAVDREATPPEPGPAQPGPEASFSRLDEAARNEPAVEQTALEVVTDETEVVQESPAAESPEEDTLDFLHIRIRTAEDVLELSEQERRDALAFLEPSELGRVFRLTDDRGLKEAVVDTLEDIHTPASLVVFEDCLDDPDPEVQLYALGAADRLLGPG